jgi:hypothetical protein
VIVGEGFNSAPLAPPVAPARLPRSGGPAARPGAARPAGFVPS